MPSAFSTSVHAFRGSAWWNRAISTSAHEGARSGIAVSGMAPSIAGDAPQNPAQKEGGYSERKANTSVRAATAMRRKWENLFMPGVGELFSICDKKSMGHGA